MFGLNNPPGEARGSQAAHSSSERTPWSGRWSNAPVSVASASAVALAFLYEEVRARPDIVGRDIIQVV